jgi:hypothetical protein
MHNALLQDADGAQSPFLRRQHIRSTMFSIALWALVLVLSATDAPTWLHEV